MEKHKICAVIFDMDGVIVDSEYVYMQYILAFVQKKNPSVTMEEIHPIIGLSSEASWGIVEKAVANGQSGMELLRNSEVSISIRRSITTIFFVQTH